MGWTFSNRPDEQKWPELLTIADDCQQRILSGIHRCLIAHLLSTCVSNVRFGLTVAQAMVDIYGQIKNPDRRGKITSRNDVDGARKSKVTIKTRRPECRWKRRSCRFCVYTDMLNKYCKLSSDDPFRSLNLEEFHALVTNLQQVMEVLRQRRREIDKSLQSAKWWRNTCNAVSTVVVIGMIVGSVVLAALVAVPVAVTAGTAAGTLMKTVEQWISSIWEERKGALEEERKVVEKIHAALQVFSSYDRLESLSSIVQKVKSSYTALATHMEYFLLKFAVEDVDDDYEAIEIKMKDMKTKIDELKAGMDLLINAADKCNKKIRRAYAELSITNA